jgi:hypothetical protein
MQKNCVCNDILKEKLVYCTLLSRKIKEYYLDPDSIDTVIAVPPDSQPLAKLQKIVKTSSKSNVEGKTTIIVIELDLISANCKFRWSPDS